MGGVGNLNFDLMNKKKLDKNWDLIIIGSGPAGFTSAIYSGRAQLKTLQFEGSSPGGLLSLTDIIENYPGFLEPISGLKLISQMREQALKFGVKLAAETVVTIEKDNNKFIIKTDYNNIYQSDALIIASGSLPRRLGVNGEDQFYGKGVSYCATCDAPLFKELNVAVVGGGDSALKEAMYISKFAKKVMIIHRRELFRAEKIIQNKAKNNPKIEFYLNKVVSEITGDDLVNKVILKDVISGQTSELDADGVFIFIGYDTKLEFLKDILKDGLISKNGRIITDGEMRTDIDGLFAAGDVREKNFRQVSTAVGDGATAAFSAQNYIEHISQKQ